MLNIRFNNTWKMFTVKFLISVKQLSSLVKNDMSYLDKVEALLQESN